MGLDITITHWLNLFVFYLKFVKFQFLSGLLICESVSDYYLGCLRFGDCNWIFKELFSGYFMHVYSKIDVTNINWKLSECT